MKNIAKRSFSMLLALVMCLGMLAGIQLPEASAASYIYNWGTRGTVADEDDFTRSNAEEWYASRGTSYEKLSGYNGSATNSSVPTSALYQQLRSLMRGAVTDTTSYEDIKTLCKYTDCQNGGGKISSFYSGTAIGPSWDGSWNREHTWPNSKGDNNGSGENDIFMLRPTSIQENSSRGNTAYGESGSYYNPNKESGGKYDLRGDVVRIMLFVYVRWQNISSGGGVLFGSSGVLENKSVMLKWLEEDPVDTWELGRNDSCQSITGTRNVFVDYPELGFLLFGAEVPDNYSTPSGAANAVSYNITATSNNTNYGTVSLSGKTITATPKTGYYVSGYTVTSGSATVTQSGNTFKVNPSSDCTVCINFAPKTAVTLTFMENGITAKTVASYGGDSVQLPSNTNAVADGYTFVGWTNGIVNDTTTKPTIYAAGSTVTASQKTYYAVYTYSVGGTGVTEWTLKDLSQIKSNDVFVITMSTGSTIYALPNGTIAKGPTAQTVKASDGKLTSEPASNLLWNLGGSSNAWEFYPDGVKTQWLNCNNDNNGVSVGTGTNKTFKLSSGYLFNNGTSRYVGVYTSNPDWRCYTAVNTNISGQTLGFYVKSESGTLYYSTSTFICEHEDTCATDPVAATCTASGYTAGVYCNDCDQYISGHEVVDALGHAWGAWVETTAPDCTNAGTETATCSRCGETKTQSVPAKGHSYNSVITKPTETQQGYTTYTCSVCGYSYKDNYTEATGQIFYVRFDVPQGIAKPSAMQCDKNGITLPKANAPEGYTFVGWTTAPVEDMETQPTILTGTYKATGNVTLYALYTYVESAGGQAANVYTLYSGEVTEGDYVIYYQTDALVATTTSNGRISAQNVTVTNDTITNPDETIVWHIAPTDDGYYTIYNEANGVYAAGTGTKNKAGLITSVTDSAKWTASGNATYEFVNKGNKASGVNANLRWNSTSIGWACYSTSTGGAFSLYKGYSGTTYYTTMTTVEPVVMIGEQGYGTFEQAYAAADADDVITLVDEILAENWTLNKSVTIDLNGYYMIADIVAVENGAVIYGMDSMTTDYDTEDYGILTAYGATVLGAEGYLALKDGEDEYSFHAYEVKLTHVSLQADADALGYKAQVFGDYRVLDSVTGYGFTMQAGGEAKTYSKTQTPADGIFSLRLKGIMAAGGGEQAITANAFVILNGETVSTVVEQTTMKETILAVNAMTSLSAAQKASVYALYAAYKAVMDPWLAEENNNIATWA